MSTAVRWSFLTNHALVLGCIAADPAIRMRSIAEKIEITERAVQRIVNELAEDGYLTIARDGRRNSYTVNFDLGLRLPFEAPVTTVADLLALVTGN